MVVINTGNLEHDENIPFDDHREKETYQKWFIFKSHRIKKIFYT